MINELSTYIEPETIGEDNSTVEMQLYAELSGFKSKPEQIDKPGDKRLVSNVRKAASEDGNPAPALASTVRESFRKESWISKRGFTITDFILLLIAGLLFMNIVTK